MLIEALLNHWVNLFSILFAPIDIPPLPDEAREIMDQVLSYLKTGFQLLANWTHLDYLLVLFGIMVGVDAAILIYNLVMWIIKKIPMLGME